MKDVNNYGPGHRGNPSLKRSNVKIEWSKEQVQEFIKCSNDPIYFIEKYMKIITSDEGLVTIKLWDYQRDMVNSMHDNRYTIIATSRRAGKSVATCSYILWYIIFHREKSVAILSDKGDTSIEILSKVQLAYQNLPKWLQHGVTEWHKKSFVLENNSRVLASPTTKNSLKGYAVDILFIDECVVGDTRITVRNKKTGVVEKITVEELSSRLTAQPYSHIDNTDYEILTDEGFKDFSGIKKTESKTITLNFSNGNKLTCTHNHLIKCIDEFIEACDFSVGDFIDDQHQITSIEYNEEVVPVYDLLNVADTHSYITNDLISHNCAHIENFPDFYASVYPTITSGTNTKVIMVSTPHGLNYYFDIWDAAIKKENDFNPILITWERVPTFAKIPNFKEKTIAALNFDVQKFQTEYEVQWLGSSGTLISGRKLTDLKENFTKIPGVEGDDCKQYIAPEEDHSYITIADVARGKGLDYSAFHVIDVTAVPFRQAFTYRCNTITPLDYAEVIYRVSRNYNNAQVLVEINDIGAQVVDSIFNDHLYENIVYTLNMGRAGKVAKFFPTKHTERGIRTTRIIKSLGCTILKMLIEQDKLILCDKGTIDELTTFSKKADSFEAEQGKHDDLVMGLVLFAWLSDQQLFTDINNIETLKELKQKTIEDYQNEMLSFYINPDEEVIETIKQTNNWLFDNHPKEDEEPFYYNENR